MSDEPMIMLVNAEMTRSYSRIVADLLSGKNFPGPFFYSLDQMFDMLEEGKMQLWLAYDQGELPFIFLITEIEDYPMGRVLRYNLLAGSDVRRILPSLWKVEKWAQMEGAFCAELSTRPKLAAILRRYGYRAPLTTMFKPLVKVH